MHKGSLFSTSSTTFVLSRLFDESYSQILTGVKWYLIIFSFCLHTGFYLFIFNWRITALQRCVSLCCTTWISYKYTYIPSLESPSLPIPSLSLWVTTEHRAELPVLHSCFLLPLCFTHGSVYMSVHTHTLNLSRPLLLLLCPQSSLNICIAIPALQIGSSVPFSWILYMCINTQYSFQCSFDLHFFDD